MWEEQRRTGLVTELRAALEEIALVSEQTSALLSKGAFAEGELEKLRKEMDVAKALALRLRSAIASIDAAVDS